MPVGLRRHLTGELGQHQCPVFGAAQKRLTDEWNERRRENSAAAEESREKHELQARIKALRASTRLKGLI